MSDCHPSIRHAASLAELERKASKIFLTTAPSLVGFKVVETVEVISAECVFGMNLFLDMFVGLTEVFGGGSESSQQVLKDARQAAAPATT